MKRKTLLSWSSGKDSAWALHTLQNDPDIEVVGLFSTISEETHCVGSHGTHRELLQAQANAAGLPIEFIELPYPSTNGSYERITGEHIHRSVENGIECFAYGDLFLEDIRAYREKNLIGTGIDALFPIWGIPTDKLAQQMVEGGLRSLITAVSAKLELQELLGQEFNAELIASLPENVDPCGENGEFHSFAFKGPMFNQEVKVDIGEPCSFNSETDRYYFRALSLRLIDHHQEAKSLLQSCLLQQIKKR